MSEHPPPQEWQCDMLGEEDLADVWFNILERPPHTSHNQVLEQRGIPCEFGLLARRRPISLFEQLKG